jgi:hypothetical protein
MIQRGLVKLGEAARGAGRLEDAAAALNRLIETYPKSALVFESGLTLAEVHLAKDPPDTDAAAQALVEAGRILRARPDPVNQARLGVAEGRLAKARGESNRALAKWYGVALLRPENDAERAVVREAMLLGIDEAVEQAEGGDASKWNTVAELSGLFVDYLPMDKMSDEMVRLQARAESVRTRREDDE